MAHLWHVALGNKAYYDPSGNPNQPGWSLTNTSGFQNVQSTANLSGLVYARNPSDAWHFGTNYGSQYHSDQGVGLCALAVRPGDVAAVPEPQTYGLMLLGISALVLAKRRRPR